MPRRREPLDRLLRQIRWPGHSFPGFRPALRISRECGGDSTIALRNMPKERQR